jgi:hypothetical protein
MLKRPSILTIIATLYLLVYVVMLQLNILPNVTGTLFFLSPLLLLALSYSIIRYGTYDGQELNDDEHWGYQDRSVKKK